MISLIDHNKRTKSLKKKGANLSQAVAEHFRDTVKLFYGEGNHNIQLVNDCIDIAKVTKGMRTKGAVAWFVEMIPHKELGQNGGYHLGAKLKEGNRAAEVESNWEVFLETNPDWYDYTEEKVQEPFNYIAYCKAQAKQMNAKHEKGELTLEEFEKIKGFWRQFTLEVPFDET